MFWMTPRNNPPTKVMGSERNPPRTTAASEPRTTIVSTLGSRLNRGAMRMPPNPASTMVKIQAIADVRAELMPRTTASEFRSTTARISRPKRVWRSMNQRPAAAIAATTNTASWSVFSSTPWSR